MITTKYRLAQSSLPALADEMKSAQVESDLIYHDLCTGDILSLYKMDWKMIKRHNTYS